MADGDADDLCLRGQSGEQRQLHLDGVFALVSGRVQLKAGDRLGKLVGQLDIGFNANYLLEILRYIPTDEVRLTFKAPERAATLEPEGWADPSSYLCLVMPLRLLD